MPIFAPEANSTSPSPLRPWPIAQAVLVTVWVDAPDVVSALDLGEELNVLGETEIVALERGAWQTVLRSQQERRQVIVEALATVGRWARTHGLRKARVQIRSGSLSHV